jgi:hypothetical protein
LSESQTSLRTVFDKCRTSLQGMLEQVLGKAPISRIMMVVCIFDVLHMYVLSESQASLRPVWDQLWVRLEQVLGKAPSDWIRMIVCI